MLGDEIVELITVTHSDDPNVVVTETSRAVYADRQSVQRSEFYAAIANGLRPTVTFVIHEFEYQNEQKLRHQGTDYLIIRTYTRDREKLELVCQAYDDVQTNLARLRTVVEIWRNVLVENALGEHEPVPELVCTVPAQIEYRGGGTGQIDDDLIETTTNATVTIQYREGITPDMFLKIDGQRWDIRFIEDPYHRHETLILTVERVVL